MIDLSALNESERKAAKLAARLMLARQDFFWFCRFVMPDFEVNWHHRLLSKYIDKFVNGEITRLMIFAPPRHGKSQMVSRLLPAYILGKISKPTVMAASYAAALARKMNVDVQRFMDTPEYQMVFPHLALGADNVRTGSFKPKRNADYFEICERDDATGEQGRVYGSYSCAGVGGPLTGMGATHAIIDDPIKDAKEADSARIQDNKLNWYQSVLYTRLEQPGSILVMHTRWNQKDLAGSLLDISKNDPEADQWVVLNLPAIVEDDTPLHPDDPRDVGEALWPSRFDAQRLKRIRASISPRWWNALYMGSPTEAGGKIFKQTWFKVIQSLDEVNYTQDLEKIVFSLDMTFDEGEQADYVVIMVIAKLRANIFNAQPARYVVLDQFREQVDFVDSLQGFTTLRRRHPACLDIWVEAKANGNAILSILKKTDVGKGLRLRYITPTRNKVLRYQAVAPIVEQGRVYVLNTPSLAPFLPELGAVPNAANDDQADAFTQALLEWEGGAVDPVSTLEKLGLLLK
jgi:predicted phage terminase large subunit-like protein